MGCYSNPTPTSETASMLGTYFTVQQVADKLGVEHKLIRKLIHGGKLEANKVGGTIRISEAAINVYLESTKMGKPVQVKKRAEPTWTRKGAIKWFL